MVEDGKEKIYLEWPNKNGIDTSPLFRMGAYTQKFKVG